jgi:hypothetical protein
MCNFHPPKKCNLRPPLTPGMNAEDLPYGVYARHQESGSIYVQIHGTKTPSKVLRTLLVEAAEQSDA